MAKVSFKGNPVNLSGNEVKVGQSRDDSRKGAKDAKVTEDSLRAWRLGAKQFIEVVLLNI